MKDKLITLLIEEEKRDRLKQHCANLDLNVSQALTKCIDDILSGSIDLSTSIGLSSSPIEVDTASIVEAVIDKLNILEITNRIENLETEIERLKQEPVKPLAIAESRDDIKTSIETPIETYQSYTLEDTKTYLQGKCDYNRTRQNRSDRITQADIATYLSTYNYPHPSNKKWNRDEVRDVCKLWELRTK